MANVWDEARKALLSAILSERGEAPIIVRTNYSRTVSLQDETVTHQLTTSESHNTVRA